MQCQQLHDAAEKALYQITWRKKHLPVNKNNSEHDCDYNDLNPKNHTL